MMTTWKSIGMVLPAVLAGCIIPLDVDVNGDHHRDSGTIEGSGYLVSETRVVADFDAVVASGTGRVIIQRTGRETLRITAEDNMLPYLRSEVENGTLTLAPQPGVSLAPRKEIVFHLEVAELHRIEGSGAVTFEAALGRQPTLDVVLSGVCVADLAGSVDDLEVTLSGVTGYLGLHLESRRARILASGVSMARVWATESLDAWASGVSSILYTGDPSVRAHTSGVGTVGRY